MADIDLQATDASYTFTDGAIFERVDPEGAGTGTYDPFLTIQHKDTEAGYNTDELGVLDNVYSNGGTDGRTNDLLLADVPIIMVDGVAYYEFRVDLNEDNHDTVLSIESLEVYISGSGAAAADFQGVDAADAFLATDGYTKVFDLDSFNIDRLVLSDVTSSGSGTDDYRFLVPVASFGDADPATTYLTLYTEMGLTDTSLDSSATFEEWNTRLAATINGVKFEDLNHNGVQDTGENGLGDVTVFIDADRDGVFDAGEVSTVTASDGTFHFYGVTSDYEDGSVWVDEVVPAGYEQTTGDHEVVLVSDGGEVSTAIGNAPLVGSISGTKMADTDNNDSGDTAVEGWGVTLYADNDHDGTLSAGDTEVDSTTTAADGSYSFSNVVVGDYIVEEESRSGWHNITAIDVGVTVAANQDSTADFVNEQLGSISGTKMADTDNNDSGDTAVEGWGVTLYLDNDHDGTLSAGDTQVHTTTTAADGSYSFTDLDPGDYIVEEETRSGWQAVTAADVAVAVSAGGTGTADFVNEQLGSISGTKMADTDNNDTGDTPVDGWGVTLYNDLDHSGTVSAGDTVAGTTNTAPDGSYSFTDLAPGDYVVEEETRSGWQAVTAANVAVAVSAGGTGTADFVNEQLASITGTKFGDLDHNGVWDQGAGELGISGWTIKVYADDGDGVLGAGDTLAGTTTTGADGSYAFNDLAPGDYIVVEGTQSGWIQTAPNGADADPESGDVNGGGMGYGEFGYAIDLQAGDANGDNDFGNYLAPGPGVRTPGFWGSPNGLKFWDGIVGNETKSGPDFPSGELVPGGVLILCDDGDGVLEDGELGISLSEAQKIINASNKDGAGPGYMLARDAIATALNALAGNPIGDVSDDCSPAYFLCQANDWLIKYENNNHSGAGDLLTYNDLKSHNVTAKSAAWNVGVSDDGIEAGKEIHSALDEYNNTGMHCGVVYAQDGDDGFSSFEQQFVLMQQTSTYSGLHYMIQ
jgi:hypothetical protein